MDRMAGRHTNSNGGSSAADQALQWFVLLRSGHATRADLRNFQEWLGADATRRREFETCSRLWGELDSVKPLFRDELADMALDRERADSRSACGVMGRWNLGRCSAVLATLLVIALMGGWWFAAGFEAAEYRTAKGERRTVVLADGSTITMNTDTVVAAEYSFASRTVVLLKGEALFAVSHAGRRPFDVEAGNRVVRDVGTQFVVRREGQNVLVTVVEGAVEVQRFEDKASTESWQMLTAGEQVSYRQGGPLSPVKMVSLAASTAWVEGKAMFEDRPLSEVIQEMGRYQGGEIRVLDPRIGALKVSGMFRVDDREGFLRALERAVPVSISRVNGELIILEEKRGLSEK